MASIVVNGDTSGAVTLSAPAVAGTVTVTLPAASGTMLQSGTTVTEAQGGTGTTTGYYGFKNRIINGAMVIDQRNAGASLSISTGSTAYSLDRFRCDAPSAQGITVQQVTASLSGFQNALTYTAGTGSTNAADIPEIASFIEGYNVADLQFGTANAQTITLSFWAKSSLNGTFGLVLENNNRDRVYITSYSLPTANTWTYITKTIVGDTSGTWLYTDGRGMGIRWDMGAGTTYSGAVTNAWGTSAVFGITAGAGVVKLTQNTGATFTITGVQLEKGATATSFDYRPFGTELALCQRYYVRWNASDAFSYFTSGLCFDTVSAVVALSNPVQMRAQPTWGTPSNCRLYNGLTAAAITSVSATRSSVLVSSGNFTTTAGTFTAADPIVVSANNNSAAYLEVTAEL